jgi:hypothetical protein
MWLHDFETEDRVRMRFAEWFVSGMCAQCQWANLELDPLVTVEDSPVLRTMSELKAMGQYDFAVRHASVGKK